jgi:hypothetical protein
MWDINAHALEFRVVILVLTTCLTNFAFQSLGNWVRRAFRTTDQFAKHFYRDHHGESTLEDVQATVRWKQRIMIAVLTTSAAAVSLSRAVISSPREEWISRTVIVPLREEWLHCSILVSSATAAFLPCNLLAPADWISFSCSFKVSPCYRSRAALCDITWPCN